MLMKRISRSHTGYLFIKLCIFIGWYLKDRWNCWLFSDIWIVRFSDCKQSSLQPRLIPIVLFSSDTLNNRISHLVYLCLFIVVIEIWKLCKKLVIKTKMRKERRIITVAFFFFFFLNLFDLSPKSQNFITAEIIKIIKTFL